MRRIVILTLATGLFASGACRGDDPAKPSSESNDATAARVVATERLRLLSARPAKSGENLPPDDKKRPGEGRDNDVKEVLKRRLTLLTEYDAAVKALAAAEHPEKSPEDEAGELRAPLERIKASLIRASKDPAALLPEVFRLPPSSVSEAALSEMKEAVATAEDVEEDSKKELDALSASTTRAGSPAMAAAKANRDETRKRIAALSVRVAEIETARASASVAEDRELARERRINLDWEAKVENLKLKESEARIELETRRGQVLDLKLELQKCKFELAKATHAAVQSRYRERVERQLNDLKRASDSEAAKAARSADPLVKYKAQRAKELFDQEALVKQTERELAADPSVSLAEETEKADGQAQDFEHLKKLVAGGRSTALVAQRLNNSYRRLESQRASIVRNELAKISALLTRYENELTDVELDQLNDVRGDRTLRDDLLDRLPAERRDEAIATVEVAERKFREMLEKRRQSLETLARRAESTRQQVMRRLQIVDDQHAFLRTHLFWVKDMKPLDLESVEQCRREGRELARIAFGIASEPWSKANWGRVSPEFVLSLIGLVGLPWFLYRARKYLRVLICTPGNGPSPLGSKS